MKDKIKKWYGQGLWTAAMVEAAVAKGFLTAAEGGEITGGDAGGPDVQPEN